MNFSIDIMYHQQQRKIPMAIRRFGTVTTRPQQLNPNFLEHRVAINKWNFPTTNPKTDEIQNWKLIPEMIPAPYPKDHMPKLIWIDSESSLILMAEVLQNNKIISLDVEENDDSYVPYTCLLQVSTLNHDYVVDCLALFGKINPILKNIFESPLHLKVMHGNSEVRKFQRDFNIFPVGVIDIQELYFRIHGGKSDISLEALAQKCLSMNLTSQKYMQRADWRTRPLAAELVRYAAGDSRIILQCYHNLAQSLGQDLSSVDFSNSIKFTAMPYKLPVPNFESDWSAYIQTLSPLNEQKFNTVGQHDLFLDLLDLRQQTAKESDVPLFRVIDILTLGFICRSMPSNLPTLVSLLKRKNRMTTSTESCLTRILTLLDKHRICMHAPKNSIYYPDYRLQQDSHQNNRLTKQEVDSLGFKLSDNSSDSSDSDTFVFHCANEYAKDMKEWDEAADPLSKVKKVERKVSEITAPKKSSSLTGKRDKARKVYQYAVRLGLSKTDLLKYMHRFPKIPDFSPNKPFPN